LLVPFLGSGASWLAALHLMTHGNHHVTIDATDGHIAIVLEHQEDDHHHHRAPASTHSHATEDDHVVTIATPDDASVAPARYAPSDSGPSATFGIAFVSILPHSYVASRSARSRVGPLAPLRSSILRI
jgi:hypothetical protein